MPRNIWTIVAIGVLFIGSSWVYSLLSEKAVAKKTNKISQMLDVAEQEAGIVRLEEDSTEVYPVRAMRIARRMKALAEAKRKEMDSLAEAANEENE